MLHVNDLSDLPESLLKENGLHIDAVEEKNPVRVQAGIKAKASGNLAEADFDAIGDRYASDGLALYIPQYAPFVEQGRTTLGRTRYVYGHWEAKGEGDRIVMIPDCGVAMVEIKNVNAKHYKTITKGLHQFDKLQDVDRFGGFGFYLLRWHWDEGEHVDWRLYPAEDLAMNEGGIRFYRSTGIEVEMEYPTRYPMWLPILKRVMKCLNDERTQ